MMRANPHWHVLGAGAIGSLLAQQLAATGCDCTLLHHRGGRQQRRVINNGHTQDLVVHPIDPLQPSSVQRLLLTTKAGQLAAAASLIAPFLAANAIVVCTANGLGFERALRRQLPSLPVYRAVSTAAAYRDSAGMVHAAATGTTRLGLPGASTATPRWFEDSLQRLEGWIWATDIDQYLGEKFSLNCAINALTALHRCRNGELLAPPDALGALCEEIEPALRALALWQRETSLFEAATELCRLTARNHSSMLQDVLAGRPTEIAFLNGELHGRAAAIGMELPRNARLLKELSPEFEA